jgi:hypothetical protein
MVIVAGMAVLGMIATLAGAQTPPAAFSLNDVMQAPFASDMLAAPTGTAVAWVFNAKQVHHYGFDRRCVSPSLRL